MKADLKSYSLAALLSAMLLTAVPGAAGSSLPACAVESGKIIIYSGESVRAVPVDGVIEAFYQDNGLIHYVSFREEKGEGYRSLGCVDAGTGERRYEKRIMPGLNNCAVRRFMAAGVVVFLRAVPKDAPSTAGVLLQIRTDTMETTRRENVIDFWALDGETIVIEKKDGGVCATAGGVSVPVTVAGDLSIDRFLDGRLLFVTNGSETEIIDIRLGKSPYQYSSTAGYVEPAGHTLIVQAVDDTAAVDDTDMIFYKIFVDGVESGRTDTGPGSVRKEFRGNLEPNREYVVKLERWLLHGVKGKYERVNNIRQPAPVRVFIPGGRVILLSANFNGKNYVFHTGPVYK